ncbi:MAG: Holliday junction resolvase RuvX [Gammaproteobacteria bacterium]|nr:Holliday junction resolvase RuvX [Gammaproteobacteria bacterium]
MPGTPETVLSFDFGLRRIGIAVGQQVTETASPLGIVANGESGPDWARIESLVRDWRPARLIVGQPGHADDSPSDIGDAARDFAKALGRFGLPVETVDERYSSIEAESLLKEQRQQGLRGRIGKAEIDSAAAMLIAERWLKKTHQ